MKKRLLSLLLLCVILFSFSVCAAAEEDKIRVSDEADLLSELDEELVSNFLETLGDKRGFEAVILTTNSFGLFSPMDTSGYSEDQLSKKADEYADKYYTKLGFSLEDDGIVLVRYINEYDAYMKIVPYGKMEKIFTKTKCESLLDSLSPTLGGDPRKASYVDVFREYTLLVEETYDHHGKLSAESIIIALVIAFIIALLVVMGMKSKLKSVRHQSHAYNYLKSGSFNLNTCKDIYLYRTVTRVRVQSNSGSGGRGGSMGGGSRGGGRRM